MSITDELKALGASDDYCVYVERLTSQDFTLSELVLPLVLQLGYTRAVRKRMGDKLRAQVRELDAKNRRIASLTKEKLWWEATNHKRNEYIEELKKAKMAAEQETARVKRAYRELKNLTFVARCTPSPAVLAWAKTGGRVGVMEPNPPELQAAYYAQRDMGMGCKTPEPEPPYVPFRDKTTWNIGDRVSIMHGLAGKVHSVSRRGAHVVQSVGIQTDDMGGVRTVHWLVRRIGSVGLEYRGQSTRMTK